MLSPRFFEPIREEDLLSAIEQPASLQDPRHAALVAWARRECLHAMGLREWSATLRDISRDLAEWSAHLRRGMTEP